jgi:hypothetical protein
VIISTDEGIEILKSPLHRRNPEIFRNLQFCANSTSKRSVLGQSPDRTSIDPGIEIRDPVLISRNLPILLIRVTLPGISIDLIEHSHNNESEIEWNSNISSSFASFVGISEKFGGPASSKQQPFDCFLKNDQPLTIILIHSKGASHAKKLTPIPRKLIGISIRRGG